MIEDEHMRHWIKIYSGWGTFPQIFVRGACLGGLDKFRELVESGEIMKVIPESCRKATPEERYKRYIQ